MLDKLLPGRFVMFLAASIASIVLPAQSAYMLGNPGWEPLTLDYLKAHNIDPSFMDEVLDGGGEFTCIRNKPDGRRSMSTMSAWFFEGVDGGVVTNAHAIFSAVDGAIRDQFEKCYVAVNRDVAEADDYAKYPIDPNLDKITIGGTDPLGDEFARDRAIIPLIHGGPVHVTGGHKVKPLKLRPDLVSSIKPEKPDSTLGTEIFLVSSARNFHKNPDYTKTPPMIQRGSVYSVYSFPGSVGQPRQLKMRADFHLGDSSSIILIRDPVDPTQLVPIGILRGGVDKMQAGKEVDGLPFDPKDNNALGILADEKFLEMKVTARSVGVSKLMDKTFRP